MNSILKTDNVPSEFVDYNIISELSNPAVVSFCSFNPETDSDKVKLYNAMSNPDFKISDEINEEIRIKDVFCEIAEYTNEETGEITKGPRIVLIDFDGKSHSCSSIGILSSLKRIFNIFGPPTWENGITCKVKQISSKGANRIFNLEVVKVG